ncbi:tetratricopeptide repeat protein [Tenacibaculum skagerrakense]|uniref:Tetratricopeptide repeat protein n=1 Tax=Tenacibaculum skagerrakense TaxID=186571 RepID=A0A4R2P1F2_9FLAO|nr:histidine kinase [Tenacibaculum skagerrakense]TCP28509.1 tetratricopeptide repeat protein [Tenacibaculum skagerrakense]
MHHKKYILIIFFFSYLVSKGQTDSSSWGNDKFFELNVRVFDETNKRYIEDAQVSVNSYILYKSDTKGVYRVKGRIHDELVVRHPDFKTVYHVIDTNKDIKVKIKKISKKEKGFLVSAKKRETNYLQLIDSARFYTEKDIDKSLSFIQELLKSEQSKNRHANTYKVLADIYLYWKQYDIAISNYKISLRIYEKVETMLQLAKAQYLGEKYEDSEVTYNELKTRDLSNYEKVQVFQGLADVFLAKNEIEKAKTNYQKGLKIAEEKTINEQIPDLNAKIANIYAKEGNLTKANTAISKTLEQASKLEEEPSLEVQQEVADFYNKTEQYDNEIKLRKEILENVDRNSRNKVKRRRSDNSLDVKEDEKETLKDSLTSQKLNYKIGNAYLLKEDYSEAVEYLKKSIKEANKKEDFEVKKHATRKLSEIYYTVGNYVEAFKTYRDFVDVVDTLYLRKEQEIYQIQRLSNKITENQSRIAILEKDKELSESKLDVAYKDKELTIERNKQQQLIIYSLLLGLVLMSLLSYYSHRANQKQKLANNLLALKSMRSQMNPHFIFNALNSVNSFIAVNDERNANRYLSEFSVLMRSVLENSDEDFIPFTKEIELLELYVKLEHNRFQDKFEYTIQVDESIDLDEYKIPPMLLQPYIENAIWHGLRYKKEKGSLRISVDKESNETIKITIQDNGIGREKSMEMKTKNQLKQKSKGMSTIKNRIAILNDMYQDKVAVQISNVFEDGSGTKVEVTLKK